MNAFNVSPLRKAGGGDGLPNPAAGLVGNHEPDRVREAWELLSQIKGKSDMAIADLTLRQEIAKGYSDLSNGKTIQAESFNNVEQMLGFVQDKLRSYDAIDYREQRMKENEPGIDFGTETPVPLSKY